MGNIEIPAREDYIKRFQIGDEVNIPKKLCPDNLRYGKAYVYSIHSNHVIFKLQNSGLRVSYTKMECRDIITLNSALPVSGEYHNLDEYIHLLDKESRKSGI